MLAALLAELRPVLLLAPQAIGGHVDHRALVEAMDGIDAPTLWWRDYPYVDREARPAEPFAGRFGTLADAEVALEPADAAAKLEASAAYASQLGFQFGGLEALRAKLAATQPTERFRVTGNAGAMLPA